MTRRNRPAPSRRPLEYTENVECYENLANAIVLQAVKDYKEQLHALLKRNGNFDREDKNGTIQSLKYFFHSAWYSMLTDIDPDVLISRVKVLVRQEAEERRKKELERMRRKQEREQREVKSLLLLLRQNGCLPDAAVCCVLQGIVSPTAESLWREAGHCAPVQRKVRGLDGD